MTALGVTPRQFKAGTKFELGGLTFCVRQGSKKLDDLRLDVWVPPGKWRAVEMRVVGMMHAFLCENEDRLFPRDDQFGADYWRAFLEMCETDWRGASKNLAMEKAAADRRRRLR